MRSTLSIAALSALATTIAAGSVSQRASCPASKQIHCSGLSVGNLYVRTPDHQLHIAGFTSDTGISPYPFLTTKYHNVSTPYTHEFAFQYCTTNNTANNSDAPVRTGFLLPNGHRYKALSVQRPSSTVGHPNQPLISLPKHDSCFDDTTLQQWWHLNSNSSLAFTGTRSGPTPGGGYGVETTTNSNGSNVFVGLQFTNKVGSSPDGTFNAYGYTLEWQPTES